MMDALLEATLTVGSWFAAGGAAVGVLHLVTNIGRKENRLWRVLGIHSPDDKYPLLLKKRRMDDKTSLLFHVPDGIDMTQMLAGGKTNNLIRQTFADLKPCDIEPLDGHRLCVTVYQNKLGSMQPFPFALLEGKQNPLRVPIGVSHKGIVWMEFCDNAPYLGIAGVPGAGKSTSIRLILTFIILNPVKVDIYYADLKEGVEGKLFQKCAKVKGFAKEPAELLQILRQLVEEMKRRLRVFYDSNARDVDEYNRKTGNKMRRILLVMDECADLVFADGALEVLTELGRKGRAAGIHILAATQHPSSKIMDSSFKSLVPAWMCFKTRSHPESISVLGHGGAEKLPGTGRCLFYTPRQGEIEMQGYYISPDDCERLIKHTYIDRTPKLIDTSGVLQ